MNFEQTYELIFTENINISGNNVMMMFIVSTLLASFDVSVVLT